MADAKGGIAEMGKAKGSIAEMGNAKGSIAEHDVKGSIAEMGIVKSARRAATFASLLPKVDACSNPCGAVRCVS